jgi:hypothetical protein
MAENGAFMNVAGWICVGVVAWFVVSCVVGLLVGAIVRSADAEQAGEAMAPDRRPGIRNSPAMTAVASRAQSESRSSAVRPDIGPTSRSGR